MLLGSVGRYRFLLAGDVEDGIDPRLIAAGLPRLDLLKVAHHGSRTATTQAFVDAVRPRIAIASAGAGNSYGHPTRQTLDRLRAAGAAVYRTDEDGSVRASFTAAGIEVRAEGATALQGVPEPRERTAPDRRAPAPVGGRGTPRSGQAPTAPSRSAAPSRSPRWCRSARRRGPTACEPRCPTIASATRRRAGRRPSGTIRSMTVPRRVEAASLLLSLDPPTWFVRHARAVAEVAAYLAARMEAAGIALDRRLVESAALLHDVDKILPAGDPARALPHGDGSAAWLTRHGHPELARSVAGHPVTRLVDGEAYRRWAGFATREERIVAYADKRAGQRLESMDARFASWRRRYPPTTVDGRSIGWDEATWQRVRDRACDSNTTSAGPPASGRPTSAASPGPATRSAAGRGMTSPLAWFWGDDELSAARASTGSPPRSPRRVAAPLERWELRGTLEGAAHAGRPAHRARRDRRSCSAAGRWPS